MADSYILLTWWQGDPVSRQLRIVGGVASFGLGDYKAQIRREQDRSSPLIAEFDVVAVADTTTADDLMVTLTLTEEQSNVVPAGQYAFDIQREGGRTIGPGVVVVNPDVTSWA